jgi:Cdc6-like AAA superfamily ATPase
MSNVKVTQLLIALQTCYRLLRKVTPKVSTGQAYEAYRDICVEQNARALTQRRFCDMIGSSTSTV